jgi:Uma2 family endonuclease
VTRTLQRPATYDDLLKVPDHLVAEIVEGELFTSPRPGKPHERAGGAIFSALLQAFDHGSNGPGGWRVAFEPEIHLAGDVFVPDVAGWHTARATEDEDHIAAWTIAPDWVCEVISPSTGRLDRLRKMPAYARRGVMNAWLVDPSLHTIEAYRLEQSRWVLLGTFGDEPANIEPFEAIEFPIQTLWLPSA